MSHSGAGSGSGRDLEGDTLRRITRLGTVSELFSFHITSDRKSKIFYFRMPGSYSKNWLLKPFLIIFKVFSITGKSHA